MNFLTGPVLAVVLLLATGAINGMVLRHGILGANGIEPLSVMGLFISLVRGQVIISAMRPSWPLTETETAGVPCHFLRRDWPIPFSRLLGCEERWSFGTKAILLPLLVLFGVCHACRKRKS